ncbi:MAG: type II toxin-antitoxin system VapC family toxin [Opitutales bacterium]
MVVDASIVLAFLFKDESSPDVETMIRHVARESAVVPAHFWFETRNALLSAERRGRASPAETTAYLALLGDLPLCVDFEPDQGTIFALARAHQLSFYDAAYLELALRRNLPLQTLDQRLAEATSKAARST